MMFKNKGFYLSIRLKILLLLTSVPSLILALYLYVATEVFKQDKLAYVFDSSAAVVRSQAAQARAEFTGILNLLKPAIQERIELGEMGEIGKKLFKSDPYLVSLMSFSPVGNQYQMNSFLEKNAGGARRIQTEIKNWQEILTEAQNSGRLVLAPFLDERIILIEKIQNPEKQEHFLFVCVYYMKEFSDLFLKNPFSFLADRKGSLIIAPNIKENSQLEEIFIPGFMSNLSKQTLAESGAFTTKLKTNNEEVLLSFSKVGFGELLSLSFVPKNKALAAVQVLLKKSLLFFALLFFVTILISLIASKSLTSALSELSLASKKVAHGDFNIQVEPSSRDEVGELAESFNAMAQEVQRLLNETAQKARMEGELKTAQTVQETLFPKSDLIEEDWLIHGSYEPASECGGDWWYYVKVGNQLFLWIGDATGHGAPAALITSAARSASTIIERLKITPGLAMELLNRAIYDVSKGQIMMTFFLASFDAEKGILRYANASHEPPYLLKKSQAASGFKKKDLIPLNEVNNLRLGDQRFAKYQEAEIELEAGDLILFYTDGVADIQNPQGEAWGERLFIKHLLFAANDNLAAESVKNELITAMAEFRQGAPLIDDVTFFTFQYKKGEAS